MSNALELGANAAVPAPARSSASAALLTTCARGALRGLCTAALAWLAWGATHGLYNPGSSLGYALGVTGAAMMLVLLLYPLRKRMRWMKACGPLKHWFALHMFCGVAGPLLVLLHTTFAARSVNAAVALSCMVLVAVSGLVGRFIYRKIHHGLYGARARLEELEQALAAQLLAVAQLVQPLPAVQAEMAAYTARARQAPVRWDARALQFLSLAPARWITRQRIARVIKRAAAERPAASAQLVALAHTSADTLHALQRVTQFRAYERLFSLWHVLHIPFVFMLVISAVVHVVAVHMY